METYATSARTPSREMSSTCRNVSLASSLLASVAMAGPNLLGWMTSTYFFRISIMSIYAIPLQA